MALNPAIKRLLRERLDTWLRLRRWVRWLCGISVVALLAFILLGHKPAAPLPVVSVKLSGPPALPADANPLEPAALAALLASLLIERVELKPAPFQALTVATADGVLPRKAADGTTPLQAYRYPPQTLPPGTKKLAVIVLELGLNDRSIQPALALPAPVTLAYDATATALADQINTARTAGHEVALDIPMEPKTYPLDDPGPDTLLSTMPPKQLLRQLHEFMARGPGAAMLLTRSGDYFTTQSAALWPLLQDLALRGIGWIDTGSTVGDLSLAVAEKLALPAARASLTLDSDPAEAAVRAQFEAALLQAEQAGQALVIVHGYPVTLKTLDALLRTLPNRGIALVPASALLKTANQ